MSHFGRAVVLFPRVRAPSKTPDPSIVELRLTEPDDRELVLRARDGDRWAEDMLVRRHFGAIASTAARLLGDREEARDLVQDTFEAALSELPKLREPAAFRSWLLQIAVHKAQRRFRRRRLLRMFGLDRSSEHEGLSELAAADASPEQRTELVLLDQVLSRLAPVERTAWTLRYVEGLALDEIAGLCGCSLATIKRKIMAADHRVREHVNLEEDV